jgi:hypothetical protein
MNDGYWVRYTGKEKTVRIQEHEVDIRNPAFQKKLSISPETIKEFPKFKVGTDREKFMIWLMGKEPIMRVRGHGSYVSFEFSSHNRNSVLDSIWVFGKEMLGPFTTLSISNFATGEAWTGTYTQFEEIMNEEGSSGILRRASKDSLRKQILKIAKKLKTLGL